MTIDYDALQKRLREHADSFGPVWRDAIEIEYEALDAITALLAQVADLTLRFVYPAQIAKLIERAAKAEADNAALRQDAERYRWLRQAQALTARNWIVIGNRNQYGEDELDATIDAALLAGKEKQP